MLLISIFLRWIDVGYEDGEVGTVQLAPTAPGALLWVGYNDTSVIALLEHVHRTELDAEIAALAPVGEDGNPAPRQISPPRLTALL